MREIGEGQFGKVLLMKAKVIVTMTLYVHIYMHQVQHKICMYVCRVKSLHMQYEHFPKVTSLLFHAKF